MSFNEVNGDVKLEVTVCQPPPKGQLCNALRFTPLAIILVPAVALCPAYILIELLQETGVGSVISVEPLVSPG
jgi:hypothetical protein